MANLGNAIINILVDVKGTKQAKTALVNFFADISTSINGLNRGLGTTKRALDGLGTGQFAKDAKALSQNFKDVAKNATLASTAVNTLNHNVQRGIELARASARAKHVKESDVRDINAALNAGEIDKPEADAARFEARQREKEDALRERRKRDSATANRKRASQLGLDSPDDINKFVMATKAARTAISRLREKLDPTRKATLAYKLAIREVNNARRAGKISAKEHAKLLKLETAQYKDATKAAKDRANAKQIKSKADKDARQDRGLNLLDPQAAARKKLVEDLSDMRFAAKRAGISTEQLRKRMKQLNAEFKSAPLKKMSQDLRQTSFVLRDAGRQMLFFSAAIIGAFAPIIITNAKFEQSVVDVVAVLNDVGDEVNTIDRLSESFLRLGETSEFTAIQIAGAARNLALAGFSTQEIEDSIKAVANLASASNSAIESTAEIAVNITRAFKLEASSFSSVADTLTAVATNSNTTIISLGESFKLLAPIAASAGQSVGDVSAALGILGNAGIRGGRAGTSLARLFSELLEKSEDFDLALQKIGSSFDAINPELVSIRDFVAELERLKDLGLIDTKTFFELFDQRSARAAVTLVNQGVAAFDALNQEIEESAKLTDKIAKARLNTIYGDLKLTLSAVASLMVEIGEAFNETLRFFIQKTAVVVKSLTKWVESHQTILLLLGETAAIVAIVVGGLGALVIILGSLSAVASLAALAVTALSASTYGLAGAILFLEAVFPPLLIAVGVVTVAMVALVGAFEWFRRSSKNAAKEQLENNKTAFLDTTNAIDDAADSLRKYSEAYELLSRLPELNPLELERLFGVKGSDPFEGINSKIKGLGNQLDILNKKREEVQQEIENGATPTNAGVSAGLAAFLGGNPITHVAFEKSGLKAYISGSISGLDALEAKYADQVEKIEELKKALEEIAAKAKSSIQIQTEGYEQLLTNIRKSSDEIKKQRKVVADAALDVESDRNDEVAKKRLETEQLILAVKISENEIRIKASQADKDSREASKRFAEALLAVQNSTNASLAEQKKLQNELVLAENSKLDLQKEQLRVAASLGERITNQNKFEEEKKKRREAGFTDEQKAAQKVKDDIKEVADLLGDSKTKTGFIQNQIDLIKKLTDDLSDLNTRLKVVKATVGKGAESDDLEAKIKSANATRTEAEADLKEAEAFRNSLPAEEKKRLDKIRSEQLKQKNKEKEDLAQEVRASKLDLARKKKDVAEEIRLTQQIRESKTKARVGELREAKADAKLIAEFEKAEAEKLQLDLTAIKDKAKKKDKPKVSQFKSIADDVNKNRVSNQDKIRDALVAQAKSLREIVAIQAYLGRVERAREKDKEKARKQSLKDVRLLEKAAASGDRRKFVDALSKAGASIASAKRRGVDNAALTTQSQTFEQFKNGVPIPTPNAANKPFAGLPGGAGVSVNSNNSTVNIDPGAIVINTTATDPKKIADEVIKRIDAKNKKINGKVNP